jgi:hypothetical protein
MTEETARTAITFNRLDPIDSSLKMADCRLFSIQFYGGVFVVLKY